MVTTIYPNFIKGIEAVKQKLLNTGKPLHQKTWQAIEVKGTEKEVMFEALNIFLQVQIPEKELWVEQIKPNLPWADLHFEERVGGLPLNPPPSHKLWPFAQKNNAEFGGEEKFSHTYPERIWPKFAGDDQINNTNTKWERQGIRFGYGDISDIINLLLRDNTTRQAFSPIWFPEDTGAIENQRVPCTIGYHFIRRHGFLHITYWIRSCDFFRHFRDDIYLAVKLADWVLNSLKEKDPENWDNIKLGLYTMHIVNLHIFDQEKVMLKQ